MEAAWQGNIYLAYGRVPKTLLNFFIRHIVGYIIDIIELVGSSSSYATSQILHYRFHF
jgi:hypothetical protein